jgi:hypothetical protein
MNQDQSPKINPSSTELANIYKFSQVRHFKIIATCIMLYIFLLQIGDVFIVLHFIEKYPEHFQDLFIALDIWHKSVKLTKKLSKVKLLIMS